MTSPPPVGQLLYDGGCGFCTAWVDWGRRRLPADGEVGVVPFQSVDLDALGTTADRAAHEVLWVDADGVHGGPDAIARWLRLGPWWARAAARVLRWPPVRPVARGVYRWVADHRHRLPAPGRR